MLEAKKLNPLEDKYQRPTKTKAKEKRWNSKQQENFSIFSINAIKHLK